jgi:hypothetical protein
MPRTRMVKPEFFNDEKLTTLSRDVRLLYIGLWVWSDDYAVIRANSVWLKNNIFPYDDIKIQTFQNWLSELENLKRIYPFVHDQEKYYFMPYFKEHQVINKPSKTAKNPDPPEKILDTTVVLPECYRSATVALRSDIGVGVGVGVDSGVGVGIELSVSAKAADGVVVSQFSQFWSQYPRKEKKKNSFEAFKRLNLKNGDFEKIMESLSKQKMTEQWTKDGGKFIPHPTTWINGRRWEDEGIISDISKYQNLTQTQKNILEAKKRRLENGEQE